MRAAEVKRRLQDIQKGVFRTLVGDAELAASANASTNSPKCLSRPRAALYGPNPSLTVNG